VRRTQVPVGVAFTLAFLSLVPAIRAAESPEVDKNSNAASEPFVLDAGVSLGVAFRPSTIDPVQHPADWFPRINQT
jgi:hypothetical protein